MTTARTSRQYLDDVRPLLGSVPAAALDFVCGCCLGPASLMPGSAEWWPECYPCKKIFETAPPALRDRFIAATTALDPSPWYAYLATYKRSAPEHYPVIASVAWQYVHAHRLRLDAMLGGAVDALVLVPSTKGTALSDQPLRKALSLAMPLRDLIVPAVRHNGKAVRRQEYAPGAFDVDVAAVGGKRILVVDDTWVTGARLVSVAGALLVAGVASVVPFAIARDVSADWCSPDHPYRRQIALPYDVTRWPRDE